MSFFFESILNEETAAIPTKKTKDVGTLDYIAPLDNDNQITSGIGARRTHGKEMYGEDEICSSVASTERRLRDD